MTESQLLTFSIACYAAFISTVVLAWDFFKWATAGPKIRVEATVDMVLVAGGRRDPQNYLVVRAYNVGDMPTTILTLGGMNYETWWSAYVTREPPETAFVINEPSDAQRLPFRFEVGAMWLGMVIQNEAILSQIKNGYLFMIVYTSSNNRRGHRVRVLPPRPKVEATS